MEVVKYVSRLLIARTDQVEGGTKTSDEGTKLSCPRAVYFKVCKGKNLFSDVSLLGPFDSDQHSEVSAVITKMIHTTVENRFPESKIPERQQFFAIHTNIFHVSFSSLPPAKVPTLQIDLIPDTAPILFHIRK